ncbi:MAG: Ppx/GppA phosphatase [Pseudonocardiales bacterium]|nr:Ppx/GppA phosphatase [Pseudonocardiales bacterium]
MTRVAALDCGTNSLRLLITDHSTGAGWVDADRQMRIVRLGQGVDRTGRLAPEALERTRLTLVDYAAAIEAAGVDAIRMVATSAVRDAGNRSEFERLVRDCLGIDPDIVSGEEEARLSFAGAVSVPAVAGHPEVLLTDIGGGSTELILGRTAGAQVQAAFSMNVGSVRLTERHFVDDPPTPAQVTAAEDDVNRAIDEAVAVVPLQTGAALVGVAGTVTTVAAMVLGLDAYDSAAIHGACLAAADLEAGIAGLLAMTHEQRSAVGVIHPGRVDVIAAGAVVLRTLLRRTGASEIVISEHDILDGIALTLV